MYVIALSRRKANASMAKVELRIPQTSFPEVQRFEEEQNP
jgi:hypothetical protein